MNFDLAKISPTFFLIYNASKMNSSLLDPIVGLVYEVGSANNRACTLCPPCKAPQGKPHIPTHPHPWHIIYHIWSANLFAKFVNNVQ